MASMLPDQRAILENDPNWQEVAERWCKEAGKWKNRFRVAFFFALWAWSTAIIYLVIILSR